MSDASRAADRDVVSLSRTGAWMITRGDGQTARAGISAYAGTAYREVTAHCKPSPFGMVTLHVQHGWPPVVTDDAGAPVHEAAAGAVLRFLIGRVFSGELPEPRAD